MCLGCVREVFSDLRAIFFDMSVGIFLDSLLVIWWESKLPPAACFSSTLSVKPGPEMAAQGHTLLSQDALILYPCALPGKAGFKSLLSVSGNLPGSQRRAAMALRGSRMRCDLKKSTGPARSAQPPQGGVTLWNDRQSLFSLLSLLLRSKL